GAILGFLKSLAAEWPRVRVKAVDVAVEDRSAAAEAILAELAARDGLVEVGRLGKRRVKLAVTPAPIKSDSSVSRLGPNSIILVTGGARGITATATLELARHANQATFVIVGRSVVPSEPEPAEIAQYHEPTELKRALIKLRQSEGRSVTPSEIEGECRRILQSREARANLERLRATGASVDYRACDTCDGDAFAKLIEDVTRQYGRIDGVIHGAGVIEDRLIQDKSIESLRRVLRTKTTGALVLAATLRAESLKFLALFSSVSGRFGNRGQADYAAGSEALNKLSQALDRRWPSRVVAIEWGPWLQTGMVSEGVRRQFVERGVTLIPSETGCRMFVEEVLQGRKGAAEIVVGGASGLGTLPAPPMAAAAAVEKPSVALRPIKRPPLLAVAGDFPREGDVFAVLRPLDPEIDLYLNDHRIDNRPVFPFAMAMELMAEVAVASRPGWVVSEVRRVRLLRGVVVNERAPMLRIVARPVEHQGDAVLSSLAVTIASVDQPERLHYSAEVVLVPEGSPPEATPPFEARSGRIVEPSPITVDEAYREWLFHGPAFQGITRIDAMDARGIRGALRTSKPSNCLRGAPEGSWLLDPILIDSAFQMQVLWARKHWDVTLLPAGVGSFRPRADSSGSMNQAPRELEYEMIIRPESGRPCCVCDHRLGEATLRGVEGTGSRALNRLAGSAGR
ncbi:MAG: SDR family NAD(P)-dependent oxidoreductase, partial [Isosphaeraceae bacterium]